MKKQKVVSLLLAAALMVPMCIPVVGAAAEVLTESKTTTDITIGSTVNLPTIRVTIGNTADIVANPYKMTYNGGTDTDTIISTPTTIKSNSTIAMDITAKPVLSTSSNTLEVLTAPITDRTKKSIYLLFNMDSVTDATAAGNYDGTSSTGAHIAIKKDDVPSPNTGKISLAAATDDTDTNAVYGAFIITGDCAGTGWTTSDAVNVKVTFDIAPVVPTT